MGNGKWEIDLLPTCNCQERVDGKLKSNLEWPNGCQLNIPVYIFCIHSFFTCIFFRIITDGNGPAYFKWI